MRSDIRFLLGDEAKTLSNTSPTRTVLEYLREDEGLCGTKEGCAEGDCGACTVMLAERRAEGDIGVRPVNACIMFLPALDGKQLLTVEHLDGASGPLHPVQQAMLDHHASQCGFCTPGFVMSLATLYREGASPDRQGLTEALAGNLCRCTGYRPILEAARSVLAAPKPAADIATEAARLTARLAALDTESETLGDAEGGARYLAPRSLDELTAALAATADALLLAGGTDIGLWVTKQQRSLPLLIATEHVAEMRVIEDHATHLTVGGAVPYADATGALTALHPEIGTLLRRIGSRQIRARGTVGGNVGNASPIGDMPPLLMALDARLVLASADGTRRLPIAAFFRGYRETARAPGEVIAAIEIPKPASDLRLGIYKVSKRFEQDISAVCAAMALRMEGGMVTEARIAFGGMAAVPKRAMAAEAALLGQPWTEETVRNAMAAMADDFAPLSDMRASAAYRATIGRNLLLKFWLEHRDDGERPARLRLDQPAGLVPA
ncbi:xanthine dehydrogenase small subunit [Acidisoma sp. 7E03]